MLTLKSKQKRWIIFIILVVSIYTGYLLSNFQLTPPKTTTIDTRDARRLFEEADNYTKTMMHYRLEDLADATPHFDRVYQVEGVESKFLNRTSNGIVSVIEIPADKSSEVNELLRNIPGLVDEKTISSQKRVGSSINVKSHIEQRELILNRLRDRVRSPHLTTREISELENQMRNIQTTIDSLSNLQSSEEQRSRNMVFATITKSAPPTTGRFAQFTNLGVYVLGSLIGYIIVAILMYFTFELIGKLMHILGIRSAKSSSRYGGYKYGSYGYGYSSKRKRKKKKKQSSEEEDDQSSDEPRNPVEG